AGDPLLSEPQSPGADRVQPDVLSPRDAGRALPGGCREHHPGAEREPLFRFRGAHPPFELLLFFFADADDGCWLGHATEHPTISAYFPYLVLVPLRLSGASR